MYYVITENDTKGKVIEADCPSEALRKAYPDFKWIYGKKLWSKQCWVYSGKDGWVEVRGL